MKKPKVRPYLVAKDDGGIFRIDVRTTRFNSQGYPLVSSERIDRTFDTATKARSFLRTEYGAAAIDIATAKG